LKLAAFFFAFAAAVSVVAVVRALRPARPARYYAPPPRPFKLSEDLDVQVGLVTLDRENARSYTQVSLSTHPARLPARLRVRTFFFSPDDPSRRVWGGDAIEIVRPFDGSASASVTVAAPCSWCADADAPRGGYFARVQVSDGREETPLPYGAEFRDISTAAPVVVHAERVPPGRR
jgi:hypothetical protein